MERTAWLRETRMQRFEEALGAWPEKRLTQEEAARMLGVSRGRSGATSTVSRRRAWIGWWTRGCRRSRRGERRPRGAAPGGVAPGEPPGLVGGALPRRLPAAPRRRALVHVGEEPAAGGASGGEGERRRTPRRRRERAHWPITKPRPTSRRVQCRLPQCAVSVASGALPSIAAHPETRRSPRTVSPRAARRDPRDRSDASPST